MNILVLNCGSSSIKYQLLSMGNGNNRPTQLLKGVIEGVDRGHAAAIATILESTSVHSIDAVGHRVVHGGEHVNDASVIDAELIETITQCIPLAPLHNPANLDGIKAAQVALPDVPHVAVFDTAFHHTLPKRAYTYAIDPKHAQQHGIRRYGFHGTSHAYVSQQAAQFLQQPISELRMISLHLGNGASACAIEFGHSTDTSMGMTPLEGLVMGTRSGDIDAGAVIHLAQQAGLSLEECAHELNKNSGLKGLSGISNDLREIETAADDGNEQARLAINVFGHRVRKYIGAYAASMGGVDCIILTGGIGENSASMRQRILQRFSFLGIRLNENANIDATLNDDNPVIDISHPTSRVKLLVIKTNEELMIAQQTQSTVNSLNQDTPRGIPVAVSARHLHLDQETFEILFGEGSSPTKYKDISQPGQYACEERVNLIGPKSRIDGVRLLGPLRSKNQVEISRTDEFKLGVDAPIRDSGRIKDSAPITLEGPNGTVHLAEGLICARRHIHMHPDDAAYFNVADKDEVEIAIVGGPRDLIYGDVLVRVSPGYKLEMHIDTDEANAAELNRNTSGAIIYTDVDGVSAHLRKKRTS
ncbi:MAG: acetate/propionate family kinase [Pseudomonadota bacterium]